MCDCIESLKIDYTYNLNDEFKYEFKYLEFKYLNYDLVPYISRVFNICKDLNNFIEDMNYFINEMFIYKTVVNLFYDNKSYLIIDDLLNESDKNLFDKYYDFILNYLDKGSDY